MTKRIMGREIRTAEPAYSRLQGKKNLSTKGEVFHYRSRIGMKQKQRELS